MATTLSILAHALQAARSGNVRKYTEAHQRDPAKEVKLANAFCTGADPDVFTQMHMNPEVLTQVACILNGKVHLKVETSESQGWPISTIDLGAFEQLRRLRSGPKMKA